MRRVLVIDDDVCIHDLAALALEREGCEVRTALTGEEGIRLALASKPEVILLDVNIPLMDGPAVLEELRRDSQTRNVPVILMTAESPEETGKFCQCDAVGTIQKPFDPNQLAQQIEQMLRG